MRLGNHPLTVYLMLNKLSYRISFATYTRHRIITRPHKSEGGAMVGVGGRKSELPSSRNFFLPINAPSLWFPPDCFISIAKKIMMQSLQSLFHPIVLDSPTCAKPLPFMFSLLQLN